MRIVIKTALAVLAVASLVAADEIDPSKFDRQIAKEPNYNSEEPLYGLVAIGKTARTRIWIVLDKSAAGAEQYDVAYVDLNGNGDLAEAAEKVTGEKDRYGRVTFQFPDIVDPDTGETHSNFNLSVSADEPATHMVSVLWRGKHKFGGGYPEEPDDGYLRFRTSPKDAPVVWLNGDGPFRFQRWYSGTLRIGGADDLKVFLGLRGVGPSSFSAFQRHVLPEGEAVLATLIYTDQEGSQREAESELKLRC